DVRQVAILDAQGRVATHTPDSPQETILPTEK
ncbi:unnamed protein product, partial [marine sediment metagenome]